MGHDAETPKLKIEVNATAFVLFANGVACPVFATTITKASPTTINMEVNGKLLYASVPVAQIVDASDEVIAEDADGVLAWYKEQLAPGG